MRIERSEPLREQSARNLVYPIDERTRVLYFTDSGFKRRILLARLTLNRIFTCISDPGYFYLSSSSRAVKRLNVSYWTCMVLCFITFFTSHWSISVAFLIPALVMCRMKVHQHVSRIRFLSNRGTSTSGT